MIVVFELDGQQFTALNGGPIEAHQCGWLADRFGLSWQIVPDAVPKLLGDHKSPKSQRAMAEMLKQKRPDIAAMQRAYDGK
jgi:predicted 3-demethylubiquinone-9 3-methyltransferase (glyoxalase superfamily)